MLLSVCSTSITVAVSDSVVDNTLTECIIESDEFTPNDKTSNKNKPSKVREKARPIITKQHFTERSTSNHSQACKQTIIKLKLTELIISL